MDFAILKFLSPQVEYTFVCQLIHALLFEKNLVLIITSEKQKKHCNKQCFKFSIKLFCCF